MYWSLHSQYFPASFCQPELHIAWFKHRPQTATSLYYMSHGSNADCRQLLYWIARHFLRPSSKIRFTRSGGGYLNVSFTFLTISLNLLILWSNLHWEVTSVGSQTKLYTGKSRVVVDMLPLLLGPSQLFHVNESPVGFCLFYLPGITVTLQFNRACSINAAAALNLLAATGCCEAWEGQRWSVG